MSKLKPFLKWAGGKTQILSKLCQRIPKFMQDGGAIENYIEPFLGGGAVFFFLKSNYKVKNAYLSDVNRDLISAYKVIQSDPGTLIKKLKSMRYRYLKKTVAERADYYYRVRKKFNRQGNSNISDHLLRAAHMIFLNKTCFNGLYRLNQKGEFNVPYGKYEKPVIFDVLEIYAVSAALQGVKINCCDFTEIKPYLQENTFIYFDPPYRPLNLTSQFTSFTKDGFDDHAQKRLSLFFRECAKEKNIYLMLSNSNPKNVNPQDNFFDILYQGFNIESIEASRVINSKSEKRGNLRELLITNYT